MRSSNRSRKNKEETDSNKNNYTQTPQPPAKDPDDSSALFVCSLSSLYSASYTENNNNNNMPSTTPPEIEFDEDDGDDNNNEESSWNGLEEQDQSLLTDESPLLLEPLGMSISFHSLPLDDDDDGDEPEEIIRQKHGSMMEQSNSDPNNTTSTNHASNGNHNHHNHEAVSFWMLWRGPLLVYFVCLVLPGMSAYLLQEDSWQHLQEFMAASKTAMLYWLQMANHSGLLWKEYAQRHWVRPAVEYLCNEENDFSFIMDPENEWNNYTSASYWMHRLNLCPEIPEAEEEEEVIIYRSVIATDVATEWKRDLIIAAALSTALTALRLLVLLVASWFSNGATTTNNTRDDDAGAAEFPTAAVTEDNVDEPQEELQETPSAAGGGDGGAAAAVSTLTESKDEVDEPKGELQEASPSSTTVDAAAAAAGAEKALTESEDEGDEPKEDLQEADAAAAISTSAEVEDEAQAHEELQEPSSGTATSKEDSLPGSALFRLVCCSASASQAWIWFHDADFWPRFAGGAGSLEHCWNLIAVDAADELYTQRNAALKYYVIVQASYYVHSVTFRWVRWMITGHRRHHLLLSVVQSALVLNLLALAYVFASLRRLMCVGMLALDTSSAIRSFWQLVGGGVSQSATRPSWTNWVRRALSQLFFWGAVLPSFVYTRFYVYPMLWHSAVNAEEWRMALEQDHLWKGSADQFLRLCHTSMGLLLLVSLVSLQTLLESGPFLKQQQPNTTKEAESTATIERTIEPQPEKRDEKVQAS